MTFRFSARTLLLVVAYAAIVVSALVAGSDIWAIVVFNLTLSVLLVAVLNAVFSRRPSRSFWGGFAIVGWTYALLVFSAWFNSSVSGTLLTSQSLLPLHRVLAPIHASHKASPGFNVQKVNESTYHVGDGSVFHVWGESWQSTRRIGHSVWALVLGVIGGWWAKRVASRQTDNGGAAPTPT